MILLTDVEETGVLEKAATPKTPTVTGQAFFGSEYHRYMLEKDKTDRIRADRIEAEERALKAEKEIKEQERLDKKEADELARLIQEKKYERERLDKKEADQLARLIQERK